MRMFRIKMTAARTNPQQIREVRIDSEKTVGELLELVRIVYEYGDVRGSLLNEAGASQSPETKLKDRIHVRDLPHFPSMRQDRVLPDKHISHCNCHSCAET